MSFSRLDLVVVAALAVGLLWIEHEHRIVVATSAAAAEAPPRATAVCPATDDVPFSADCIRFIDGGTLPDVHARTDVPAAAPLDVRERADLQGPPCPPSNETAPYSARCIRYMSGWFWHADPAGSAD